MTLALVTTVETIEGGCPSCVEHKVRALKAEADAARWQRVADRLSRDADARIKALSAALAESTQKLAAIEAAVRGGTP